MFSHLIRYCYHLERMSTLRRYIKHITKNYCVFSACTEKKGDYSPFEFLGYLPQKLEAASLSMRLPSWDTLVPGTTRKFPSSSVGSTTWSILLDQNVITVPWSVVARKPTLPVLETLVSTLAMLKVKVLVS